MKCFAAFADSVSATHEYMYIIIVALPPQMREIELCPSCYSLTVKQPEDWFCIPCVSAGRACTCVRVCRCEGMHV